ncbi:LAFA_0F13894g1_1 [Lachancea sp. 'fantastica']|nr:LAFA_0F13894g1_1 [Lachancea sp. 'fantastica']
MSFDELHTLNTVASLLCSYRLEKEPFQAVIPSLSSIVLKSSQDSDYRKVLAENKEVWHTVDQCAKLKDYHNDFGENHELRFWYLRTFRGLVMLARNLSVSNNETPQTAMLLDKFVKAFNVLSRNSQYEEMDLNLFKSITEFSCNVTTKSVIFDRTSIDDLARFLCYPIGNNERRDLISPHTMLLRNLAGNGDFVYYFLKTQQAPAILYDYLIQTVSQEQTEIPQVIDGAQSTGDELSTLGALVVSIFWTICSHESFAPYLQRVQESNEAHFLEYIKLLRLVITSSQSWDNFQLTGIMTWCFRLLEETASDVKDYFKNNNEDEDHAKLLHDRLIIVLDMLTNLTQYEHVRKFMNFYKGLELLVDLLHLFQEKLLRLNVMRLTGQNSSSLKVTNSNGVQISDSAVIASRFDSDIGKIKATNFPECKLLIIEILCFLVYKDREVQDKMRKLQGLEAVLSNCVIDDNDPFIKERSIMCIKMLLEDNAENQKIVAQLETKKPVDDDLLSSAGYKVNVGKDGKIQIAPPAKQ